MGTPLNGWRVVYSDPHHHPPHLLLLEREKKRARTDYSNIKSRGPKR